MGNTLALNAALAAVFGRYSERWRPADPLEKLVKIVLNHRTTGAHAQQAMTRLRANYPDWADLAALPHDLLVDLVRPAGLAQQKAARIHGILAQLYQDTGAYSLNFLEGLSNQEATRYLRRLPGVGALTAALVLMFALGREGVMPVEGQIHRVARRLGMAEADAPAGRVQAAIEATAPGVDLMDLHVNLIELGHRHCTPVGPDCLNCPVSDLCRSARL
ncbi:MAG: endonuclease III domain-containing protein [Bacillota bacterium]